MENYFTFLEKRTWELMECIEQRQVANGGSVSLSECFSHWAYDLMVSVRTFPSNIRFNGVTRATSCMVDVTIT